MKPSDGAPAQPDPAIELTELAHNLEREVNQIRKSGDVPAILALARPAVDTLDSTAGAERNTLTEEQISALQAARRIAYNAPADAWPGWELDTPARSSAELDAALNLARGSLTEALAAFHAAAGFFADAPAMKLLAQGYMAIAAERFGSSPVSETPKFEAVIAALDALGSDDAKELRDQLLIAREIFAGEGGS